LLIAGASGVEDDEELCCATAVSETARAAVRRAKRREGFGDTMTIRLTDQVYGKREGMGVWFLEAHLAARSGSQVARFIALLPEVLDVDVGAEAGVVGEVPAWIVRVVVEHEVVGVP